MLHIKARFQPLEFKWKLREATESGAFDQYVTLFIRQALGVSKLMALEKISTEVKR